MAIYVQFVMISLENIACNIARVLHTGQWQLWGYCFEKLEHLAVVQFLCKCEECQLLTSSSCRIYMYSFGKCVKKNKPLIIRRQYTLCVRHYSHRPTLLLKMMTNITHGSIDLCFSWFGCHLCDRCMLAALKVSVPRFKKTPRGARFPASGWRHASSHCFLRPSFYSDVASRRPLCDFTVIWTMVSARGRLWQITAQKPGSPQR